METRGRTALLLLVFSLAIASLSAVAQVVTATVPTGGDPAAVAVNPVTNKIYVPNYCGNDPTCSTHYGTVTEIDGRTLSTATVAVGIRPDAVAVNPVTNKIYVVNQCGNDPTCQSNNETVTAIDGTTLSTVTLSVGFDQSSYQANAVAVNPLTNKIYVIAPCGDDPTCISAGTVSVIDGASNLIVATITVGSSPYAVAVNRATNEIYVVNVGDQSVTVIDGATNLAIPPAVNVGSAPEALGINELTNQVYVANVLSNSVTVIDAVNNSNTTTTVPVGSEPQAVSVNPVTNLVYVANLASDNVTVIDGQNNVIATINVGTNPFAVGVNPVTNKIYVANEHSNTVTVIDGTTNFTVTVPVGYEPTGMAVNSVDNRIYVGNQCGNDPTCNTYNGTVSVIAGANPSALQFIAIAPCRVVDTRNPPSEFGGPPIPGQTYRSFPLPQGSCGIPASAAAYSLNVTVVPNGPLGYLSIWPTGEDQPVVSTMNSLDGRIKANAAIVPAGYQEAVNVYVTSTSNVVLDIDGYFVPVSGSTLAFYPLTPCRVLDTRNPIGPLGGPHLQGGQQRDFPVRQSQCGIPSSAQAYAFNFTVVPIQGGPVGYLTVWPAPGTKPLVSTLNDLTGTIVANAAIVQAGTGPDGDINAYASNDTDLVADVTGYFALAGFDGALSLYPAAPCRVLDTRLSGGAFSGERNPPVNVVGSSCGVPSTAEGYVLSVTVVPQGSLGYLTLWPDGQNQPLVSTLNALDGAITSNMAILQNFDGETDAYASGLTQLILDISSYFAP